MSFNNMQISIVMSWIVAFVVPFDTAVVAQSIDYIDADKWLQSVSKLARVGRADKFFQLERYDPALIVSYFRQCPLLPVEGMARYKLNGLLAYGEAKDIPQIRQLIDILINSEAEDEAVKEFYGRMPLVVAAREGDKVALDELTDHSGTEALLLVAMVRTSDARDALVFVATDEKRNLHDRIVALECLRYLGDDRCLSIFLSESFTDTFFVSGYGKTFQEVWEQVSGAAPPFQFSTPEEARAWVRRSNFRVSRSERVISVRGGIDWSRLNWNQLLGHE
jgi:hypothetical protein